MVKEAEKKLSSWIKLREVESRGKHEYEGAVGSCVRLTEDCLYFELVAGCLEALLLKCISCWPGGANAEVKEPPCGSSQSGKEMLLQKARKMRDWCKWQAAMTGTMCHAAPCRVVVKVNFGLPSSRNWTSDLRMSAWIIYSPPLYQLSYRRGAHHGSLFTDWLPCTYFSLSIHRPLIVPAQWDFQPLTLLHSRGLCSIQLNVSCCKPQLIAFIVTALQLHANVEFWLGRTLKSELFAHCVCKLIQQLHMEVSSVTSTSQIRTSIA